MSRNSPRRSLGDTTSREAVVARVAAAVAIIREEASRGLGVAALAEKLRISRGSLEKDFRSVLGLSPYRQIVQIRMAHAKRLLVDSTFPVGEIAARVGFAHASHFVMRFKQFTGCSPAFYRTLHCGREPGSAGAEGMSMSMLRGAGDIETLDGVDRAKRLLVTTSLPVREIGRIVGFGDASYFVVRFRRSTGYVPGSYRRIFSGRTVGDWAEKRPMMCLPVLPQAR